MGILRKVIKINSTGSKAVILPKTWLDVFEEENGQKVNEVLIEVNGEIRIRPYLRVRSSDKVSDLSLMSEDERMSSIGSVK